MISRFFYEGRPDSSLSANGISQHPFARAFCQARTALFRGQGAEIFRSFEIIKKLSSG